MKIARNARTANGKPGILAPFRLREDAGRIKQHIANGGGTCPVAEITGWDDGDIAGVAAGFLGGLFIGWPGQATRNRGGGDDGGWQSGAGCGRGVGLRLCCKGAGGQGRSGGEKPRMDMVEHKKSPEVE